MKDRLNSEYTNRPQFELPVKETPDSVSYLGVCLPKAKNKESVFVPKREQYTDFIEDQFSLDLEKNIAVSFLQGEPLLIEGGTSIGKTTTVRKMAAELGWETHYVNLNGATDVEDLMGRYIPNPNKKNKGLSAIFKSEPEYIFVDGKVTSGLRQEEGKVKVIILDEFNSAAPNILIRLHEVIDSLGRGESVVLSEDASESIAVNKNTTKIIALMNPPGKGYLGREPLDPAQLRRWVYLKAPNDLPEETFSYSTDALFSLVQKQQEVSSIKTIPSRESALLPEQLNEIPGISEILAKYKEFHSAAKQLVKNRNIAADQPQPFTYDDRMEPRRVRDFVLNFFNGDINETFKAALNYYYVNKLNSNIDRKKLEELVNHVEYIPPKVISQRKGLERDKREETIGRDPETFLNGVFDLLEKDERLKTRSFWDWCFDGKYVDMSIENYFVNDMFIDDSESVNFDDSSGQFTSGIGIDDLLKKLEDKRIVSIKSEEGGWFLKVVPESEEDSEADIIRGEVLAWKKVLGVDVNVPPIPYTITPRVREKLKDLGMELRYIPEIDLGTLEDLKNYGVERYLDRLQNDYPNWQRLESMTIDDRDDILKTRNLREFYWEQVQAGNTSFPKLSGKWIAVETMPKPKDGKEYLPSKITDKLGLRSRFNVSCDFVDQKIPDITQYICSEIGLNDGNVRMLELIEWNLLANREGWGNGNTFEWTNTSLNHIGEVNRFSCGSGSRGGAGGVVRDPPIENSKIKGFRLAMDLTNLWDDIPF